MNIWVPTDSNFNPASGTATKVSLAVHCCHLYMHFCILVEHVFLAYSWLLLSLFILCNEVLYPILLFCMPNKYLRSYIEPYKSNSFEQSLPVVKTLIWQGL